ncbi:MAG TPA: sigma-54-dependent Fis family transcriptional regulator, partial [Desulfomicrobium sp.]|nr:sigma-54-dependent Fis family transcriptional regulator [Desulfomicrobium sp.]
MAAKRILFISRSELVSPLHAQFKAHDCQAMVVEDRASAMKVIEGRKADLVFTLPSLPGYRAQDLLETVQQSGNPLPVIVFTDKGSADEARLFMELGAQDYWLCPLTWEKVQAALPADGPSAPATP